MKIFAEIALFIFLLSTSCYAWNDEATHPTLSEFSAEDFFGVDFMEEIVMDVKVRQKIRDGSQFEDTGTPLQFFSGKARSLNHFHNPARATLGETGLTDIPSNMSPGMSTLLWAQDGNYQKTRPRGDWSWQKVRDYQYNYATALSKAGEDENLANMLTGLGYQMHLVQDMGQPNHVRNDTHVLDGASWIMGLETWARRNDEYVQTEILGKMMIPAVSVDLTSEFKDDTGNSKVPVARLFDTRGYKGTRPPTASFNQGLAEYTNSNFFSETTVFAAEGYEGESPLRHYNPYPNKNETNVQEFVEKRLAAQWITDDGEVGPFETMVISKQNTNGEKLNCVATSGPFTNKLLAERGQDKYFYRSFMYDACFPEYAAKLIPASAAYSYAMLDYFFRGKLTVTVPPDMLPTNTRIRLNMRNSTETGEEMTSGTIDLMVIYRQYKKVGNSSTGVLEPDGDFQFRKYTSTKYCAIQRTDFLFDFDLSGDPLPPLARDVSLIVVYRGNLGNEQDAVAYEQVYVDAIGGEIDLSLPAGGVYAKVEGDAVNGSFNEMTVAGISTTRVLNSGNTELLVLYKESQGDPFQSQEVASSPDIKYASVTLPQVSFANYLPPGSENPGVTFPLAGAPVPVKATDVYVYVIHTGSDGKIAFGYKDTSEPTPVDIFSNTDKVCLWYQWYDANSPEAVAAADRNGDTLPEVDPYSHSVFDIFAKYTYMSQAQSIVVGEGANTFTSRPILSGGSFRRLGYILTDYQFKYGFAETWQKDVSFDDCVLDNSNRPITGTAVKNQTDFDGTDSIHTWPGMYSMRGHKMWWGAGLVYDNIWEPNDASCDWSTLQ